MLSMLDTLSTAEATRRDVLTRYTVWEEIISDDIYTVEAESLEEAIEVVKRGDAEAHTTSASESCFTTGKYTAESNDGNERLEPEPD